MYKEIVELRPYFRSLREIKDDMTLDLQLPIRWESISNPNEYPNVRVIEQDANDTVRLVSYITKKDELGYKTVFKYVKQVISINIEKERKEKLLLEKINELKKLFKEKDLNSLENLNFEQFYEKKGESIRISNTEGSGEDEFGDSKLQEETD